MLLEKVVSIDISLSIKEANFLHALLSQQENVAESEQPVREVRDFYRELQKALYYEI